MPRNIKGCIKMFYKPSGCIYTTVIVPRNVKYVYVPRMKTNKLTAFQKFNYNQLAYVRS